MGQNLGWIEEMGQRAGDILQQGRYHPSKRGQWGGNRNKEILLFSMFIIVGGKMGTGRFMT